MRNPPVEHIRSAVEARADEIIEWSQALIRFPSENRPPLGNEGPAQEFVAAECRKQGWDVDVFAPDEVPGVRRHPWWLDGRDYSRGRADVVARRPGRGGGNSLLLSGHIDVAPFEPDDWQVCRPFDPLLKEGKLYGRGSADMKGGLTAAFWALRVLDDLGVETGGDVLFESLVDEEFAGGNGTLGARLRGHNAGLAVVAEPSRMRICPAGFGAFLGSLTIKGTPGMPYVGEAIPNPVHGAGRAIELFRIWQDKWRSENSHPMFVEPGSELNTMLWHVESANPGEFIQMGTPLFVRLRWIVWCHPGMTEEEFYRRFGEFWNYHAENDEALRPFELTLKREYHYVRPWETPADDPSVRATSKAFAEYAGSEPVVTGFPASADYAIYGEVGNMPVVYLGPRGGALHAPDEWVEVQDILDLTGIYARLACSWCGTGAKDDG